MDDARLIENLIYQYADHIDQGNLEAVAELFRDGSIISKKHNSRQTGYQEVLAVYQASCRIYPDSGTPKTRHLTTNVQIEVASDGMTATAHAYYTVIQATDALPLQPIISGRYKDAFKKVDDDWQFHEREMLVDLVGDCSAHLLYDPDALV